MEPEIIGKEILQIYVTPSLIMEKTMLFFAMKVPQTQEGIQIKSLINSASWMHNYIKNE